MINAYTLETWRTEHPKNYPDDAQALKEFIHLLVNQTKASSDTLNAALKNDCIEIFKLALQLQQEQSPSQDLVCSWLLVAAQMSYSSAMLLLASSLADLSTSIDHFEEDEKKIKAEKNLRKLQENASIFWLKRAPNAVRFLARYTTQLKNEPNTENHQTMEVEKGKPSLQVLEKIGDPTSAEGRSLGKRYSQLLKPIPLKEMELEPYTLKKVLDYEYPWLSNATEKIISFIKLRLISGETTILLPPLLLVGPPGTGKTTFVQSLSRYIGVGCTVLSCAGSADNRMLQGTARGWSTTQPCGPILAMTQHKAANPLYLIDEIEKANDPRSARNGSVQATLLNMLEPISSQSIFDECLLGEVNLSHISWIATANSLEGLSEPLLNRFTIVKVEVPQEHHFETIIAGIKRRVAQELNVTEDYLPELHSDAIAYLKKFFLTGASVRKLKSAYRAAIATSCDNIQQTRH